MNCPTSVSAPNIPIFSYVFNPAVRISRSSSETTPAIGRNERYSAIGSLTDTVTTFEYAASSPETALRRNLVVVVNAGGS